MRTIAIALLAACWAAMYAAADTVNVTATPGGLEAIGVSATEAHVLSLGRDGTSPAWSDSRGNTFLAYQQPFSGVEVADGPRVLYPAPGSALEIKTNSAEQVEVIARSTNGLTVTWTVLPQRLGLRVEGTNAAYIVRLRYPTHGESCSVHAGQQVRFATAGIGSLEGSPQLVVEAKRTRAMSVTPPAGSAIRWQLSPVVYPGEPDYLLAEMSLRPGQTLWLATASIPAYDGPVEFGFFRRATFRRTTSAPVIRASLSSTRLPVTLTLDQPTNTMTVAALFPVAPDDPVAEGETYPDWWYHMADPTPAMLPLEVNGTTISSPTNTPSGVYRMRVWIVPRTAPLPEALGGPKGAVVGYFPGVQRGNSPIQNEPTGDVFVSVHRPGRGSVSVVTPNGRHDFWRGEKITLLVQSTMKTNAPVIVRHAATGQIVAGAFGVPPSGGVARIPPEGGTPNLAAELSLTTDNLAPGEYRVEVGAEPSGYSFTIAPPRVAGMALLNSQLHGPSGIASVERLGLNVWTDIMPGVGGYAPGWADPLAGSRGMVATDQELPPLVPPARNAYDDLVRGNWLWLQGIQSRQLDFFFYHSIPEQVEESLRKKLVYAQLNQRFPSMLGLVFDYDLAGVAKAASWGDQWETFGTAGEKRTALLNARWEQYWKEAQTKGATAADQARAHSLFNAGVIEDQYRRSLAALRDHVPEQRHTSSVTADHATMEDGQYLPSIYRPLDFRYLEVWNDQVYPCSAHDMQESFWASLLRMEQPTNQPLWITVSTAHPPGTHFRRSLSAIGRGVTGVGYGVEGDAGLWGGNWGADPSRSSAREADVRLTGDMTTRYGAFLNQFVPREEVAILYSVSQGGSNFAIFSPVFIAYHTLARLNRPAQLLTEDQIANGALAGIKALLLVRQTAALPPATLAAIEKFAATGGKVIADRDTTLPVKGLQKLDVFWPNNLWPTGVNEFHTIIQTCASKEPEAVRQLVKYAPVYYKYDAIPRTQGATLLAALGDTGRQSLEIVDGDALLNTKVAGTATLVLVANENIYPFHDVVTDAQIKTRFFRYFMQWGMTFYKDVRTPRQVILRLRADLAAAPPRIYDVFAGRELRWQKDHTVAVDLATLQARALLLTPDKIEPPTVWTDQQDARATIVVRSATPLPIRVRVGDQEVFRAATAAGSCDTFALAEKSEIEVTELITGKTRRGRLELSAPSAKLEELPAVQVYDAARVKRVLASKGLAIYMDARQAGQLDAAKRLAAKIPGAEVVFNPPIEDYVLDWDLPADTEAVNERIRQQQLVGRRRPIRWNFQWMGALAPAIVWNRPAVVFGHAGNNRLIADLNSVTLLPRPARPETIGAGRGIIGVAGTPFWNDQDVVYALCADASGTEAVLEKLALLTVVAAETNASPLAERRQQLGFEPFQYPAKLIELRSGTRTTKVGLDPCIPVVGLQVLDDGALVALGSPGRNLVRLDNRGREKWRVITAGWYQPVEMHANAAGESLTRDIGESGFDESFLAWRHDAAGKLRWKMIGSPVTAPAADGSLWMRTGQTLKQVNATGNVLQSAEVTDKLLAFTPDGRTAIVQRAGTEPGFTRVKAAVVAIGLPNTNQLWMVEECEVTESRLNDDGQLLACVEKENFPRRDDISGFSKVSRLTVVETATGRVRLRTSLGQAISSLLFSPDGTQVMARLAGYSDVLYLADIGTGLIRQVKLPEAGGWAHAFARDGKTLWVACEKLYGVDTASLQVRTVNQGRIVQLAATRDGLIAGTADGRVLWLNGAGQLQREVNLAGGIAIQDARAEFAPLRDARLVDSPALRPHEVPATVNLVGEFPRAQSDPMDFRGDGVFPVYVAVHVAAAGKYRFSIPLHNAKTDGEKLGTFDLTAGDGPTTKTQPLNGDKWTPAGTLDLTPGTWLIRLVPINGTWKVGPLLRELKIEQAEFKER